MTYEITKTEMVGDTLHVQQKAPPHVAYIPDEYGIDQLYDFTTIDACLKAASMRFLHPASFREIHEDPTTRIYRMNAEAERFCRESFFKLTNACPDMVSKVLNDEYIPDKKARRKAFDKMYDYLGEKPDPAVSRMIIQNLFFSTPRSLVVYPCDPDKGDRKSTDELMLKAVEIYDKNTIDIYEVSWDPAAPKQAFYSTNYRIDVSQTRDLDTPVYIVKTNVWTGEMVAPPQIKSVGELQIHHLIEMFDLCMLNRPSVVIEKERREKTTKKVSIPGLTAYPTEQVVEAEIVFSEIGFSISNPVKMLEDMVETRSTRKGHIRKKRHAVESHYRTLRDGRRVPVRAHERGDSSLGYVRKIINVTP